MLKPIQSLQIEFLEYLDKQKNRSSLTIRNYDFYLRRFLDFSRISQPAEISLALAEKYRHYLSQLTVRNKPLNQATINYHLIALRSFLKYLSQKGFKKICSIKEVKLAKVKRRPGLLSIQELESVLEAPLKIKGPPIIKWRDKAILELIFSTGLKVSAVANLNLKSIDFIRGKVTSNNKEHHLSNQAKYWLKKYLDWRSDQSTWLFISHDRANKKRLKTKDLKFKGLTPRSIQRLVEKYAAAVGIAHQVTPQSLRYAYAHQLLLAGADIKEVQKKLGHRSANTTALIYQ